MKIDKPRDSVRSRWFWIAGLAGTALLLSAVVAVRLAAGDHRLRAAHEIEQMYGDVTFYPVGPVWLVRIQDKLLGARWKASSRASVGLLDLATEDFTSSKRARFTELLKTIGAIDSLSVSGKNIDDKWLTSLENGPRVAILCLSDTSVTDAGLERACCWPGLEIVKLQGNPRLTRVTVERIRARRPGLDFLSDLK
jgi:hypothetical protein